MMNPFLIKIEQYSNPIRVSMGNHLMPSTDSSSTDTIFASIVTALRGMISAGSSIILIYNYNYH